MLWYLFLLFEHLFKGEISVCCWLTAKHGIQMYISDLFLLQSVLKPYYWLRALHLTNGACEIKRGSQNVMSSEAVVLHVKFHFSSWIRFKDAGFDLRHLADLLQSVSASRSVVPYRSGISTVGLPLQRKKGSIKFPNVKEVRACCLLSVFFMTNSATEKIKLKHWQESGAIPPSPPANPRVCFRQNISLNLWEISYSFSGFIWIDKQGVSYHSSSHCVDPAEFI